MAMPTTGALLINPRRRKRKATRRKKRTSAARSRASKLGWSRRKRRRNTTKGARRKTARRAYMKTNRRRRSTKRGQVRRTARRAYTKRRNTKRGQVRTTARRAYTKRRNTRRGQVRRTARRAYTKRRNPNALAGLQQAVKRIPVVGPIASDAVGLGIPALFGAISIEPVMMGLKWGGAYIPAPLQKISFSIGGLVMGALVKNLKFIGTPELRKQFAVAIATAGGAVDYYRWKTGQGTVTAMAAAEKAGWGELEIEAAEELEGFGELELAVDGFGELEVAEDMDGFGELELAVDGWGDYDEDDLDGWAGWGELEDDDSYTDAALADSVAAGDDMSSDEIGAFKTANTPRVYKRRIKRIFTPGSTATGVSRSVTRFRPPIGLRAMVGGRGAQRPTRYYYQPGDISQYYSRYAGKPGHRWGWLIKLVGFDRARQVAALPTVQRRNYIAQVRNHAVARHQSVLMRAQAASYPSHATA
jgi:hypothetical protein